MNITVTNYADFVTIVTSVGSVRQIFYWDDLSNSGQFIIHGFIKDGDIHIRYGQNGAIGSFSTDFPNAVQVNDDFSVS